MVQLWFPGLKFNGLRIDRGQFLDVSLLGVGLQIPPWDMGILPVITFWEPFLIFDSDWVVAPVAAAINAIPNAVWGAGKAILDGWAAAFYEKHCTYEEYMREKRAKEERGK